MTATRRHRWPRILAGTLSCLVLVATAMAGVGFYYAKQLTGNITADNALNWTPNAQPAPTPGEPINILLMGSDTREGKNGKGYGHVADIAGARSDTTILLHISGDRTRALAVSIPRDSQVQLPVCKTTNGTTGGGYTSRFNEAFEIGGPSCTVKAVQQLTGVPINHYLVVDFTGFKNVVSALGGVEVCLKEAVNDPKSRLNLPAGKSVVHGEQALAFVRARYALGDGSDIGRIERQQEFLSSAIRKATSAGVLVNPPKLYKVLQAGTKSLTTDPGLANFDALKDLAVNGSGVKPSDITFATVPWTANADGGTVSWVPSQADELWKAIRDDQAWPPPPTNGLDGQPLTAAADTITLTVKDATGTSGGGFRAADQLQREGYTVAATTSGKKSDTSFVRYDPADKKQTAAARTLAYSTGVSLTPVDGWSKNVTLTVGADYQFSVKPVVAAKEKSGTAAAAKARTASDSICSG